MTELFEVLEREGCDAYVAYDSSENADMRYLAGFLASDPYIYILSKGGNGRIVVSSMEELRARKESPCDVITRSAAGFPALLQEYQNPELATAQMIRSLTGKRLLVPASMPVGFAHTLMSVAEVRIDRGTVAAMRERKTFEEAVHIRNVQRKTEDAVHAAIDLIRRSEPDETGYLVADNAPVTSERIRDVIAGELRSGNCEEKDTIISCGPDTAMPHCLGTGQLRANQPIVMDVFPRSRRTGYFADMTRTVSKGDPSPEIQKMYETVRKAKELAVSMLEPGVSGADVHNTVVSFFEEQGYTTAGASGFIHSLGHGVGLEIHEGPSLSVSGGKLRPGNIITIEPGLYYPGTGGVRLEDMGMITEDGFDRFTNFEEQLIL